jgi:outer membrane receptor protein involved in Fe transport
MRSPVAAVSRVIPVLLSKWRPLLLVFAFSAIASAQTGTLQVEVKDSTGAAVEASGRLETLSAGVHSGFNTNTQGSAMVLNLTYGRYRLTVARDGFATHTSLVTIDSASVSRTIELQVSSAGFAVEVVGGTVLPGVDLERNDIPAPVQSANAGDIDRSFSLNMADFLNRRINGVFINDIQSNPYQPDVNYRGYTASPLLGTPQGISVYMDGVRLNQPFGDVVSWDLIPRIAIAETTLMPGSNPLFGLNTLGGALALTSKDGYSARGTTINLGGGSFGRKMAEMEHGGNRGSWNWYGATNFFFENGWRQNSPSDVRQFFGRLGWQGTRTTINGTFSYANNALVGNGLQEQTLLAADYTSFYTKPDITHNRSPFAIVNARHAIGNNVTLAGNVYYRYIKSSAFNGDINEGALDQSVYQPSAAEQAALTAAGFRGFPAAGANATNTPFPFWRCIANVLLKDEPGEKCNGLINRSSSKLANYGASGQMSWATRWSSHRNRFTVGAGYDRNRADFVQSSELGYLNPDRSITGTGAYADGVNGGEVDGEPFDTRVDLRGKTSTGSVFFTDTLNVASKLSLTASGRFNRTTVDNYDRIRPKAGTGSLTGKHDFQRFNPALGATYNFNPTVNAYFNFAEGSRAPTSIELGCADPNTPCRLPNALAGDPPLNQVLTRTYEAGIRGKSESRLNWSAGWFRADNRDDILFVASVQTGFGYFKNFGETLRQGMELNGSLQLRHVTVGGGYTLLNATFQSTEEVNGQGNSTNHEGRGLEGLIEIQPGNRIPLIPRHLGKVYADIRPTSKLLVNLGLTAFSGAFARGNENNEHEDDGTYYLGEGTSPGYAVINLGLRYQVHRHVELWAQVNNFLDLKYYSGAQLGPMGFTNAGNFIARPFAAVNGEFPVRQSTFLAPGAPRGAWAGIRFRF